MTPFRFAQEFSGEQHRYWELFFDEPSIRIQLDAGDMKSYEIVTLEKDTDVWRRVIRATPARDLPAVVRRVTGASLGYTETSIFTIAEGRAVTTVEPNTLAGRIDFSGTHTLEETGARSFVRIFEGSVDVRVALVGKNIERAIIADMESSYRAGAALTAAGLTALSS